jgi:hypothetical protein
MARMNTNRSSTNNAPIAGAITVLRRAEGFVAFVGCVSFVNQQLSNSASLTA